MTGDPTREQGRRPTLRDLMEAHEGAPIFKWMHYPEIYDRYLERYRGSAAKLLEIGVYRGGSMEIWRKYLGPEAKLYGVDIDPHAVNYPFGAGEFFVGDQADPAFLRSLVRRLPKLDVVIDDGGHQAHQQITSFEILYPHVADNGLYIVEDTHTSFWPKYGGGYGRESFLERAKRLIDQLHQWYWYHPDARFYRGPPASPLNPAWVEDIARTTYGLHFYDSMLVIEKAAKEPPWWRRYGNDPRAK